MLNRSIFAVALLLAPLANAEPLRVVTSIAPLQALVADVMEGVGTPNLLLNEATSAHDFAMRPSQAKAISDADVIFYVGQNMEPWLEKALWSRKNDGTVVVLGDLASLHELEARELDEISEHHDDHDHDDHDHEGAHDPHMWLDPENALIWLDTIKGILEASDPENKTTYQANYLRVQNDIIKIVDDIESDMATLAEVELIVTHDSIQYFEHAFDLNVIGAFSASDGQTAGAHSLNKLLDKLGSDTCIVEDVSHPNRLTASLPDGTKHVVIDPMGYAALGTSGSYSRMLSDIAESLLGCRI